MSDITITAMGSGEFGVQVREGETETSHRVTVPEDLLDDLGIPDVEPEEVVRESFAFLLEREPASSIMREFALSEVSKYFPEYLDELRSRLS